MGLGKKLRCTPRECNVWVEHSAATRICPHEWHQVSSESLVFRLTSRVRSLSGSRSGRAGLPPLGAGGACEGVVRAHATAGPPPALRLDLEVPVQAARRRPIQISDGARLIARPSGRSRDPLDTRACGPTLAERNPTHPPLCRPAIRTASAAGPQRCPLETNGWGGI